MIFLAQLYPVFRSFLYTKHLISTLPDVFLFEIATSVDVSRTEQHILLHQYNYVTLSLLTLCRFLQLVYTHFPFNNKLNTPLLLPLLPVTSFLCTMTQANVG